MNLNRLLIGSLLSGVVLFVWSGLTQMLPWGVPSTQVMVSQSGEAELFQTTAVQTYDPHALTTPLFDDEMVNRVNTLTTDETFSWIVTKPLDYYNPTSYFVRELLTQLLVGVLLTTLALLTPGLSLGQRLTLFLLMGMAAATAVYGPLFNWWGLTTAYALGAAINLIVGWLLVGLILSRFVSPARQVAPAV